MAKKPKIDFVEPPRLGTVIDWWKGSTLRLIDVEPYERADGSASCLLIWKSSYGRIGATGLRSNGIVWRT